MPIARRLSAHEKRVVAARDGWKCAACGGMLDATYEIDHRVPLHLGGDDDIDNCEPLHKACHALKTQREEIERLRRLESARYSSRRPPLECSRCGRLVSPYFLHRC